MIATSTEAVQDGLRHTTTTVRAGIHLAPRRMTWDFSAVPACPVRGDPDLAAFLVAVSYFVVAFEDVAIPIVRAHLPHVADHPALEREARAFVAQEALHSQAHARFNAMLEGSRGFRAGAIVHELERFKHDVAQGTPLEQLAAVVAFEHVIYSVADWYEKATALHRSVDPEFHRLLLWHAMEETEHTAVVCDVYAHIYGDRRGAYAARAGALLRVTRLGGRALFRVWRAAAPQMAERAGTRRSPIRSGKAFLREAGRYSGDFAGFLSPGFSPVDKSREVDLLPALREQMAPPPRGRTADRLTLRVRRVRDVAAGVRAYELAADDGSVLPPWSAGAHVDVEVETGIVRQYSLCGDPSERTRYVIAVKREALGRGGSLRLHQHVMEGGTVRVGPPRNNFPLPPAASRAAEIVLVAGGIGVTPLLAMAHELHAAGARFTLHACARNAAQLPFAREMDAWPFRSSVRVHLDGEAARSPGAGVDFAALAPQWNPRSPRELYVCGPRGFTDAVCARARESGWPAAAIRVERFSSAIGAQPSDRAFTVRLARRDATLTVEPGQSIVEAMEARGMEAKTACREGLCGACVCRVLAGDVEHRDVVLSDAERRDAGSIAICVSRARGESLMLDL